MDIKQLYKTQISLTEWLAAVNYSGEAGMRKEDNEKRDRLKILHEKIDLPYDAERSFLATDLNPPSDEFADFLKEHGNELCALRLVPYDPALPKLRMRGHSVGDVLSWFNEQSIDPSKYRADFVPHSEETMWSTIFIVNQSGVFGEVIRGGHHQLTQGFYENKAQPITFAYNFQKLNLSTDDSDAAEHVRGVIGRLKVEDVTTQKYLSECLQATFCNDYLLGYFETVFSEEFGLWFIDYNRILGRMYQNYDTGQIQENDEAAIVKGFGAKGGKVTGRVCVVRDIAQSDDLAEGDVLICEMTTPEFIPLMRRAAAVITDFGGILSHAAIVSRELALPCIVGAKNATQVLQTGMIVDVDADSGLVRLVK